MIKIRGIQAGDIDEVNVLREKIYRNHVNARPDIFAAEFGKELKNVALESIDDPDSDMFVMVETDENSDREKLLGYIGVSYITEDDTVYFQERKYCYIDELYVLEDSRGKGVAKKLLQYTQKVAKEKQCAGIYMDVWDFNEDGKKVFKALGFRPLRHYLELEVAE